MAVTNQFDISSSTRSPSLFASRASLVESNGSESNRSVLGTVNGSLNAHEILYIFFTAVLVPVIIVTNVLVAFAVGKFKRLQTPTNFYIVSLAAADIFIAIVLPFFTAIEIVSEDIVNTLVCIAPNRMLMMASGVSILTLSLIAYDRHTALSKPLRYVDLMTKKRIITLICLSWLYSATVVWAPIMAGWYHVIDVPDRYCTFEIMYQNEHLLFVSALFAPSCIVIFVCYIRIYIIARHHARAIASLETSVHFNLQTHFIAKDSKYAKTLAVVIGAFLLLWLPFQICLLYEVVTYHIMEKWIRNYCAFLAFTNSALNPWIYAYNSSDIRLAFKRISRSLSAAMHHGHLKEDERRISVVSNLYSSLGNDVHLSKTDSRYAVLDDPPSNSRINVEINYGEGRLSDASARNQFLDVPPSASCSCRSQRLPNSVTGLWDDKTIHLNTCPYYRQSHTPSMASKNRQSTAGARVVSFLEFLSMDDDHPVDCALPEVGGRISVLSQKYDDPCKQDFSSNLPITTEHPHAVPDIVNYRETTPHSNVHTKLSTASLKSCESNGSVKRVLSFVDIVSLDNESGKLNINSEVRSCNGVTSAFSENKQHQSPTKRSSVILQSPEDKKIQISKTNSCPGLENSYSTSTPRRKNAAVLNSDCNVLSFINFHSFDDSSSVEDLFNFPAVGKKESVVSLSVDIHHPNQELILDSKSLTAQFLSSNNGQQEINLCLRPQNTKLTDHGNIMRNRSCSVYSSQYSGQRKNLPRLSRQYSVDYTIC